jgi:hypothetical protein
MQTMECKKCITDLPLDNYYFNKNGKYKRQNVCKKCMNIYDYETDKNHKLKKAYGITLDEYNKLLSKQKNKCSICEIDNNGKYRNKARAFAVDHCHNTNKIRGLLCSDCNIAIGLLKDNTKYLQSAINYLNKLKN